MSNKKTASLEIELVDKVHPHTQIKVNEFLEAEEGDTVGPFKVASKEKIECQHDRVYWSLKESISSNVPTITGRCKACGLKVEADSVEVEADLEQ